jgi:hypothetical protein
MLFLNISELKAPLLFHSIMQAPDKIYSFYMVDISWEINGKNCAVFVDSLMLDPKNKHIRVF